MKNKKWLIAIAIIGLLIFAFFWGGNQHTSTTELSENSINKSLNSIGSTVASREQQEVSCNDQGATELNKQDTEVSTKITDEKKDIQSESSQVEPSKVEPSKVDTKPSMEESFEKQTSNTDDKKDKYLTDPIPEGKPKPVEWQDTSINENKQLTCTLSVTCKTILDNIGKLNKGKLEVVPKDGVIYKTQTVNFSEGESVFDVLLKEMKKNKIHMEFEMTPIYNSNYIEGIHNLYEFDCGELSGWMYRVNGWFPNYGCSRYALKNGDAVEWIYTCDLGKDIGGGIAVGGKGR